MMVELAKIKEQEVRKKRVTDMVTRGNDEKSVDGIVDLIY